MMALSQCVIFLSPVSRRVDIFPLHFQTSDQLYQFLQENNEHATHFFIGTNILNNPKEFLTAFDTLNGQFSPYP